MRRYLIPLGIIYILSFLFASSTVSFDGLQVDVSGNDFNIVLITIDTLRADHLSCYGYHRETTPNIDKIANNSILFTDVIAPSSWTSPSMVSLFTSLYPINHGVIHGFCKRENILGQEVFSKNIITLTEILKRHGYTTFGIAANLHLSTELGFARGFDYYNCLGFETSDVVNKIALSWKDKLHNSSKYFLWIHYFDPHASYFAREPWIKQYDPNYKDTPNSVYYPDLPELEKTQKIKQGTANFHTLIARYDSEINYVDNQLKILTDQLELLKNSILIITSDHGEGFLEHGKLLHGNNLYGESIKVPLIIRLPRQTSKKVIDQQVSLLDIMPTILSLLNISYSGEMLGKPLITSKGEAKNIENRFLFTELGKGSCDMKAVLTKDWKYIYNYKERIEELYNRKQDTLEQVNLINENLPIGSKLETQLIKWVSSAVKFPSEQIKIIPSKEMKEKLDALGYINGE